jgi:hypothetical protein
MQVRESDINAQGGLLGRPVKLVYYDDQSKPAEVPAIYSKLLDVDKVDLIVSGYASTQIAAAMPVAVARKKLFVSLFGTGINNEFKYVVDKAARTELHPIISHFRHFQRAAQNTLRRQADVRDHAASNSSSLRCSSSSLLGGGGGGSRRLRSCALTRARVIVCSSRNGICPPSKRRR